MFRTIWLHFGQFGCLTKLGAKRAEQVQKVVPRSRFVIFHNKDTRSTPLDPKLKILVRFVLFECICNRLVALRNSVQKRAELVQKFVTRSRIGIFLNERSRSTPLDPKLMF